MTLKRNAKYDFYRGLLMLGVVWGHVITALRFGAENHSLLSQFLRTYDMPFFAFISGYFLAKSIKKHNFFKNVLNKVGMILFPILLWNIIYQCVTTFVFLDKIMLSLSFSPFWFLWAIFIVSIMVLVIEKLFRFNKIVKASVYILVTAVIHTVLDLPSNAAFLFVPCVFGVYYDDVRNAVCKKVKDKGRMVIKILFVVAFFVMQIFWDISYNVWNTGNNIFAFSTPYVTAVRIVYRTSIGLVGTVAMMIMFGFLYDFFECKKVKNALCGVGKNTLEIYILQSFVVEFFGAWAVKFIVKALGYNPFFVNGFLLDFVFAFIVSAVSVTVCYYIQKWFKLVPLAGKYLFGLPLGRKK